MRQDELAASMAEALTTASAANTSTAADSASAAPAALASEAAPVSLSAPDPTAEIAKEVYPAEDSAQVKSCVEVRSERWKNTLKEQ